MYKLGVIEESLESHKVLEALRPFFYSQRTTEVPDDEYSVWHVNEYHVPDENIADLLPILERKTKRTWYSHAFNEEELIVVLHEKSFRISLHKDETWDEMIVYGDTVGVERRYLEDIPLSV